jgi:hypothetical protein
MYNDGKENKYYSADSKKNPWAKFRLDTFVYTLPDVTGVNTVMRPDFSYSVNGNSIMLSGLTPGTPVTIATADGKVIASTSAQGTTCTLPITSSGIHILKVGNKSVKLTNR